MERTSLLQSKSGTETLWVTQDDSLTFARLHFNHVDEFDAEGDYWVTLGEFPVDDLIAALLSPVSAAQHAATKPLTHPRRRWRRKGTA